MRWEYRVERLTKVDSGWIDQNYANKHWGQFVSNSSEKFLVDLLNELGSSGWELVGIIPITSEYTSSYGPHSQYTSHQVELILKRGEVNADGK